MNLVVVKHEKNLKQAFNKVYNKITTRRRRMKRIIRVFARKTSMTPMDDMAFYDVPGLFIPAHDEIHVVVTFTWDLDRGRYLYESWHEVTNKPVLLGGVAFDDPCNGPFVPGLYLKPGVTVTSRGCVNNCAFCLVPKREGRLREIEDFAPGHIVQDNNFLACSKPHRARVYEMLKGQKAVRFSGGIESEFLTDWDVEQMRGLRIESLWLACDSHARVKPFLKACEKLVKAGFSRHQIRCYALIGNDMSENEARLRAIYRAGAYTFAMLYQPRDRWIEYPREWRQFQRKWIRPAAIEAHMKEIDEGGGE